MHREIYEPRPSQLETQKNEVTLPGEAFWEAQQGYVPELWVQKDALDNGWGQARIVHPRHRLPQSSNNVTLITCDYSRLFEKESYEPVKHNDQILAVPTFMLWRCRGDFAKRYDSSTPHKYREELERSGFVSAELTIQNRRLHLQPPERNEADTKS